MEELDGRIGDLLKVLEDEKLKENTIVVFISDNGTEPGQKKWGSAYPFPGNEMECVGRRNKGALYNSLSWGCS